MRVRRPEEESPGVDMAPLIDCMFILLIFFLVTATLKKIQPELPVDLPIADAVVDRPAEEGLLVLGVDSEGRKYFRNEPVTTSALLERLAEAAAEQPGRRVRIDGDMRVSYQHIVEIIEACQINGLTNIGLHTRR